MATINLPKSIMTKATTAANVTRTTVFLLPQTSTITFEIRKTPQLIRRPPSQIIMEVPKLRAFIAKMFIITAMTTYNTDSPVRHS